MSNTQYDKNGAMHTIAGLYYMQCTEYKTVASPELVSGLAGLQTYLVKEKVTGLYGPKKLKPDLCKCKQAERWHQNHKNLLYTL